MVDSLFIIPMQTLLYSIFQLIALSMWRGAQALILGGYMIQSLTDWITDQLFGPAISEISFLSNGLMPTFLTIAVFLLAFSYLLSPFFRIRVVAWQKALGWILIATLFFQFGPSMYVEGEHIRRAAASDFYAIVINRSESAGSIGPLAHVQTGATEVPLNTLSNQFGPYIASDDYIDGLDVSMSYILATGLEVLQPPDQLPADFTQAFFPPNKGPIFFLSMTGQERNDALAQTLMGIIRLILGYVIITFGIIEQLIYLSLSIAAGILFINMALALPFALFERTEAMARSLLDMWLELFIFSMIVAAFQAVVVGIVISTSHTLNPALALGAGLLGLLLMGVLLLRAVSTIWDAMNRMFVAMSQVVGGQVMSPAEAGMSAAGAAAGLALTAATAGAGALVAAGAGASGAQVLGSALGGIEQLYNTAAMGSMVLPQDSPLRGVATGFYEGALSQRMLGPAGGLMLAQRQPQEGRATAPTEGAAMAETRSQAAPGPAGGETDVRFDAADLAGLRTAVATAMEEAIRSAPPGGYSDSQAVMSAIRTALGGAQDARTGEYLSRHEQPITSYVMVKSAGGLSRQAQATPAGAQTSITPGRGAGVAGGAQTGGQQTEAALSGLPSPPSPAPHRPPDTSTPQPARKTTASEGYTPAERL